LTCLAAFYTIPFEPASLYSWSLPINPSEGISHVEAGKLKFIVFFAGLSKGDQNLILKASKGAADWANDKIKKGEGQLLIDLQRKGMQVVIPDADSFREKGKPAVEELFKKEWPVTTWAEVLAQ
jgi:hypothetical protein